jgi:hypothetical protein
MELMNLVTVDEFPSRPIQSPSEVYVVRNIGLREGTHKFHRYPGKFIPHVPRWAIKRYAADLNLATILDPFCGSGTVLVESALAGHVGIGFDVDPIARLVSKVKTTALNVSELTECQKQITDFVSSKTSGGFRPDVPTLSHWFSDDAIRDLGVIRDGIELFRCSADVYDFLLVTFLSIIRRTSNADNQTQKTYVSHTHAKTPEPPKPLFFKVLEDYVGRILDFGHLVHLMGGRANVLGSWDARDFSRLWKDRNLPLVDLAITSPPYVKSVDYVYNQMAEYFWVGDLFDLSTQPQQNRHKEMYIGTQKVPMTRCVIEQELGLPAVDSIVSTIAEKDAKNGYITSKYFADMRTHFHEMAGVLRPSAHYVMVVGDSIVSGYPVETHTLIGDCAASAGFIQEHCFAYEIRNRHMRFPRAGRGGLVKYDWIVDFRFQGND